MIKIFTLSLLITFSALNAIAQEPSFEKQFKLAAGLGYANSTMHNATGIAAGWLQMEYQPCKKFSLATEFENMGYYFPIYYKPAEPDFFKAKGVVNSFSFLAKYHLFATSKSKLRFSVASGVSYSIVQKEDFITETTINDTSWIYYVNNSNQFRIPFLLEAEYPVYKFINLQARVKYSYGGGKEGLYNAGFYGIVC